MGGLSNLHRAAIRMKRTLRQLWQIAKAPLRIALGILLVLVGILGLLLPILPGWIFIFPGLALLLPGTRADHWLRLRGRALRMKVRRWRRKPAGESPADDPDTRAEDAAGP